MDYESYEVIIFIVKNLIHLDKVGLAIDKIRTDKKITSARYEPQSFPNNPTPIIKELESYNELIESLKEYREWLDKQEDNVIKDKIKWMVQYLDNFIDRVSGGRLEKEIYDRAFSKDSIVSTLDKQLLHLSREVILFIGEIKLSFDNKFEHIKDTDDLHNPNFYEDNEKISKLYDGLIKTLDSNQNAIKFLQSSSSSFSLAMLQFDQTDYDTIYFFDKTKGLYKDYLISHLINTLFHLLSTYDKILVSIGYSLGGDFDENFIDHKTALNYIEGVDMELKRKISGGDRTDAINTARKLRNAETHRFSQKEPTELKGYIVSLIKEIIRLLEIFDAHIKQKTTK